MILDVFLRTVDALAAVVAYGLLVGLLLLALVTFPKTVLVLAVVLYVLWKLATM
jgi:hypothetical protein